MSDRRLTELHKLRDAFYLTVGTPWDGQEMQESADALAEAVDEILRLRAEVERLLRENLELKMIPVFKEHRL